MAVLLRRIERKEKRYPTGVEELDKAIGGGLPQEVSVALSGPTGVGKTMFALNFSYVGALRGENVLFVAMEDTAKRVMRLAKAFTGFEKLVELKKVMVLDYPPMEIEQLFAPSNPLQDLIEEYGIERVVLDSYYPIAVAFDTERERARATFQLLANMESWGTVNLLITEDAEGPTRFGLEEHTDGWIEMVKERGKRKVVVRKLRYTTFKEKAVPFTLYQPTESSKPAEEG